MISQIFKKDIPKMFIRTEYVRYPGMRTGSQFYNVKHIKNIMTGEIRTLKPSGVFFCDHPEDWEPVRHPAVLTAQMVRDVSIKMKKYEVPWRKVPENILRQGVEKYKNNLAFTKHCTGIVEHKFVGEIDKPCCVCGKLRHCHE
ncbi:hypothetical protein LCGC14_0514940 [marine sediment metagenome]|uniref:Uncharacterized protein n=1 Tax=marine sediment metagenome TaxID=412755 RepID=A0A0F9V8D0_9ZZZZ|nr:hypothetical protein [Candidatus Aminicenantes bacterium]